MHSYITSLLSSLSMPGLSPRAITLFTQAMAAGQYRWGRKAKLVAGASIAIALRDAKRPDSLHDIAFLINESSILLTRTFSKIVRLLNLALTSADPSLYLSTLHTYLSSLFDPSQCNLLPAPLLTLLKPLSLTDATRTANALATLLSRLGDSIPLAHLPTPPTACALLILSLEAEARTAFNHLSDLAQCLASRFGIGKGVVLSRYKTIQDLVADWIKEVPWLDKYECKKNGRAKMAKRLVVARGLKDVVHFQGEIWTKKLEALEKPTVDIDVDPEADEDEDDNDTECRSGIATGSTTSKREATSSLVQERPPRKRRKTAQRALDEASQFLLNPLSVPVPSSSAQPPHDSSSSIPTRVSHDVLPLTSYLLEASTSSLTLRDPPTRLQLLAVARGGTGPEEVDDDELFEEGEWERIIRDDEEEIEQLRQLWAWDEASDEEAVKEVAQSTKAKTRKKEQKGAAGDTRVGSKRVNMDALAKILDPTTPSEDDQEDDDDEDDFSVRSGPASDIPLDLEGTILQQQDEVVVDEWRPLSPTGGALYTLGTDDRYDMEYE